MTRDELVGPPSDVMAIVSKVWNDPVTDETSLKLVWDAKVDCDSSELLDLTCPVS